jgi:integrase
MGRKIQKLDDTRIDSAIDFELQGRVWDSVVPGLRIRIGKRKHAWEFYTERRDHGARRYIFKVLGFYDRGRKATVIWSGDEPALQREEWHMGVEAAREAARILAGKVLEGNAPPGKRSGVTFEQAFDDYCDYLERKATGKGKPARWAKNVRALGKQLMLPKWGNWSLAEMSERPDAVEDWHRDIVKQSGPTSANHCARIIRALYKRRAKRDLTLNKANIPTAAVEMHTERGEQKGMAPKDFPTWFAAWEKIENQTRRAYHMVNLLTGARPGELARTRWENIDDEAGTLTIGDAKAGNDIAIPITPELRKALKLAADAAPNHKPGDLIFPGCSQFQHRDRTELPARGHALRRTYKTIATTQCKVPDDVSAYLLGHVPEGMSQRYLLRWAMSSGTAIREAQAKISRTMTALLHKKKRAATLADTARRSKNTLRDIMTA